MSGILPEMVLCGGPVLIERLLVLMQTVWREGCVYKDWRDALIVPVPKNHDLQFCNNWRGISLLDVVSKLFAQIIQDHLQVIAEGLLLDSQCGFRRGRGCVDMIFVQTVVGKDKGTWRLLVHDVYRLKAYDSMPRSTLW